MTGVNLDSIENDSDRRPVLILLWTGASSSKEVSNSRLDERNLVFFVAAWSCLSQLITR